MTVLSAEEARLEFGAVLIARVKGKPQEVHAVTPPDFASLLDHSITQALIDIELDAIAQAVRDELNNEL